MREMNDSGIEWIGAIPIHWKCCRQKYEIQLLNGRAYKDTEFEEDGTYKILRVGNLYSNSTWYTSSLELAQTKYCFNGDLLYSWSMSYGPHIWHGDKVIYHYHIWKAELKNDMVMKYAYYYLLALTNNIKAETHETTMGFVTMSNMNNSYIVVPPCKEQILIATYLDKTCSKLDSIYDDIQHQIELLQEYKQSVITEAVTKGLDKNVAMKDSAIEWIGDIPHTWNIYRLKYIIKSSLQYGANESGLEYTDELPRYVRITDIDNNGRLKDTDKQSLDLHTAKPYLLDSNDILLARSGATVGKAFLYHESDGPCAFAGYLIRAKCKTELLSKLVYYYTMSYSYNDWKNSIFSQATIPNIGADKYSNLRIPISPNEKEQRKIIDYLDQKCAEIDAVLTDKQKQLDTLTEYKKSLIYEYVTGKKEVPADA